jgi:hypothetical protein
LWHYYVVQFVSIRAVRLLSLSSSQQFSFPGQSAALRPTPNLEDQVISLVSQLEPVWQRWPYQKLSFNKHSILHHSRVSSPPTPAQLLAFVKVMVIPPVGGGVIVHHGGQKRPERKTDLSRLSSAKVNVWSSTSTSTYARMA